jgi:hypothetical protein
MENGSYTGLGHLQSQMTPVAAEIYHQLHWSVTPAGQVQGLGSMTVGIGFVGGWGSCTLHSGRSAIDAWLPGVQVVAEPEFDMDLVMIGAIAGLALAVTMHQLRLAPK